MPVGTVILIETSAEGNLGAAMRVAANFSVERLHLVRPVVDPDCAEVRRWACGAEEHLEVAVFESLSEASARCRTLAATASGRGRDSQSLVPLPDAGSALTSRGLEKTALVFGNETSGLRRADLDVCDLVVQVPTNPGFPVLNLTQTVAIVLAHLSMPDAAPTPFEPPLASQAEIEALMGHLGESLLAIGFLDPVNPQRMLRKIRRLFGRAGVTEDEVAYLRGMCRQILWAARTGPLGKDPPE